MSISILGVGSALPKRVLTNDDLSRMVDTSDEWIRTRTGISERHIMMEESVTSMALDAARLAMEDAGVTADEIDFVLCPTLGGDYLTPSLACMVQAGIGAECPAMDMNAACSGFIYSLHIASALLGTGAYRRILVVSSEGLSRFTDWNDRGTAVLFGDGAGAAVLGPGDDLKYMYLSAHGNEVPLHAVFTQGIFPERQPGLPEPDGMFFRMDGQEVYKFAVNAITTGITTALDTCGLKPDDVGHVFLHQANMRIIDAARKKLDIPQERYAINIDKVGNISAATIPVLLHWWHRDGLLKKGEILVLSGFGGGFTTGTCVVRWNR
ncbi:MAG: ketoacyl-ACP synthase III [Ruminococcaceae bacterium]|nr:ketoacyl-ACP synthase III [Oscillospiraceae bacterium]